MKNNKLHIIYAVLEAILCILLIAYAIYIYNNFFVCYVFEGTPPFNRPEDECKLVPYILRPLGDWALVAIVFRSMLFLSRTKIFKDKATFSPRWYNIATLGLFFFVFAMTAYMAFKYGSWIGCDVSISNNYEYFSWHVKDLLIVPLVLSAILAILSIPDYFESRQWYKENCKDEKYDQSNWCIIGVIGLIILIFTGFRYGIILW